MKLQLFLFVIFATLFTLHTVDAQYVPYGYGNSYGSYPSYGSFKPYYENTNFFANANINKNTYDNSFSNSYGQNSLYDAMNSHSNTQQNAFVNALFNNAFQNTNQNLALSTDDGYNFKYSKCTTNKGKIKGISPDTIKWEQKVCGPLKGTFYKANSYDQNVNDNSGYNTNQLNAQAAYNNYFDQGSLQNQIATTQDFNQDFSETSKTLQTSFGKGSVVVFG